MMQYERDFIYKTLPELTKAIEKLAKELKRYNDNNIKEENEEDEVRV